MQNHQYIEFDTETNLEALRNVARLSNNLAKQVTGAARTLAYKIKAEAISSLIVAGGASMNGIWPGGIIALDLVGIPAARLHIRRSHLTREAREFLDYQAASVPAVYRLGDHVQVRRGE